MKNKRNVLIAFILICCLCLSIGYAALTDTLYVDGKVDVTVQTAGGTTFEENLLTYVYWDKPSNNATGANAIVKSTMTEAASSVTVRTDTKDSEDMPDVLCIDIPASVWQNENDTVTINAQINNDSYYDISVAPVCSVESENDKYFNVECTSTSITAGNNASVTITVTLDEAPSNNIVDAKFTITLTATTND